MARITVTDEMVEKAIRETDWAQIEAQTDEDIARHVSEDPDAPALLSDAEMAAAVVRLIRHRQGLTQTQFAARYAIPVGTLRDWEQNRKQPDSTAIAYLRVIAKEPDAVAKALAR